RHCARKHLPYFGDQPSCPVSGALEQVLLDHKEGLDGAHLPRIVLENEIAVVEALLDRVFNNLVIAAVLAGVGEGLPPGGTLLDVLARSNMHDARSRGDSLR